jgi:hypothetical protein
LSTGWAEDISKFDRIKASRGKEFFVPDTYIKEQDPVDGETEEEKCLRKDHNTHARLMKPLIRQKRNERQTVNYVWFRAHNGLLGAFDQQPNGKFLLDENNFPSWPDTEVSLSDGKVWDVMQYRHLKPVFSVMKFMRDSRTGREKRVGWPLTQDGLDDIKKVKQAAVTLRRRAWANSCSQLSRFH